MTTERQQLLDQVIREKRISIDMLENSNREYRQIINFIKAPGLVRLFNGLGAWLLKMAAFLTALSLVVIAFFLIFSLYWPNEVWEEITKELAKAEYQSVEEIKIEAASSLMSLGVIILVVSAFLIITGILISSIRKRSRTIYQLSTIMTDMLSHQEKYLKHEQDSYLSLSEELKKG